MSDSNLDVECDLAKSLIPLCGFSIVQEGTFIDGGLHVFDFHSGQTLQRQSMYFPEAARACFQGGFEERMIHKIAPGHPHENQIKLVDDSIVEITDFIQNKDREWKQFNKNTASRK